MKKYYQYFGLALIMVFSFYYTEKIALIVLNKNPLMQTINEQKDLYEVDFVNAIIDGEYIIPGKNGLVVNTKESFYNMQSLDIFNEYYLIFDQAKPDISLENNKDKIINKGNSLDRKISIILEEENEISEYFKEQNIKADLLVDLNTYQVNSFFEVLNGEKDGFKSLDNSLNLNKENVHICLVDNDNREICQSKKYYLVEPTLTLNNTNYINVKNNINNGVIIFINANAKLEEVILLLKEIKYKDLSVVYLSELISEQNTTD